MSTNLRLIEAARVHLSSPYNIYARENRQRVSDAILENDPELRRRIDIGSDQSDSDENTVYYEAEQEMYSKGDDVMRKEFEAVSESEKERLQNEAIEHRNQQWRRFRQMSRLVENEESLAQKAEDEKNGISGPVPVGSKKGVAAAGSSSHQVTGTFIGGQILTPLQELTPPFDRNTLKMKTGNIEVEEYL